MGRESFLIIMISQLYELTLTQTPWLWEAVKNLPKGKEGGWRKK